MTVAHDALATLASSWRSLPRGTTMHELDGAARALRALTDETQLPALAMQSFKELGVFRSARPREAGGLDFDPMQQTRIIEEIGRIDLSAAWRCMIGMDSGIYYRYLPDAQARDLLSDPDSIAAGWVFPAGVARRVAGGYLVDGTWHFASGIDSADLVVGGCLIQEPGAAVPLGTIIIAAPRNAFVVDLDSWNVSALRASGSFSYATQGLMVPESQCFRLDTPVHAGPLTRRDNALARKMAGVALGAMRGLLDWLSEQEGKQGTAWDWAACELLARHEYAYLAVRGAVYATLEDEWGYLCRGEPVPPRSRAMQAMARREAFLEARRFARELLDLCGSAALRLGTGPAMRMLRDLDAACQHAVVKPAVMQAAGALLRGRESHEMFI